MPKTSAADGAFLRRVIMVVAIVGGALILWQLRHILVLLFGAVLIATVIRAVALPFSKHLRCPEPLATTASILLIVAIVGGTPWLIGAQVAAEAARVADTLPRAMQEIDAGLANFGLGHPAEDWLMHFRSGPSPIAANLGGWISSATEGVVSTLILIFGGIFLATQPRLYAAGLLKLFPPARRALIAEAMEESETALRLWLRAELWAMLLVGLMTFAGLWLLGVDSALVLSLIAGVLEFVPYMGAIVSSFPAIMVALVQSPELALWTVVMYVIVHHLEAYLIQPLIQQYAVDVPAVIILFSLLGFAVLFGILGIILAAPMAVVAYVLVKRLYVIEALNTPTPIPGETKK